MAGEFAGRLSERIVIEAPRSERGAGGARLAGWREVARCLAAIAPAGLGPPREAMALSAMAHFSVTIRARRDVALDQRLRWRGRVLRVRAIHDDPRAPDRMTLTCEEERGA